MFDLGSSGLPGELVLGVALGTVLSVGVAGVFLVGERLSPTRGTGGPSTAGDDRRRAEIRRYLRAIGEPFDEKRTVGGHAVAFYLPERDVAITFDARAYYRLHRADTHAVLVEHELPGGRLGHRLPFETPAVASGRGPVEVPDPTAAAFAELSLPPSASAAEVRAAYRERVKAAHPDHGGSRREFRRVREAYTTAKRAAS